MKLTVRAPAKINLTLDVVGVRESDGYHLLQTVMQTVGCTDEITMSLADEPGVRLHMSNPRLPTDDRNTAVCAARAFLEAAGLDERRVGLELSVRKRIPVQAGMAGGSADAAGVLVGLDRLFRTGMPRKKLCAIGAQIGADVPFCVMGGTARGEGIGTELTPLPALPDCRIVVAKPYGGVSTAAAYQAIDRVQPTAFVHPDHAGMEAALHARDLAGVGARLCNLFEQAADDAQIRQIRQIMERFAPLGSQMTGSGSAVFALFPPDADVSGCVAALREVCREVFTCRPWRGGPSVLRIS